MSTLLSVRSLDVSLPAATLQDRKASAWTEIVHGVSVDVEHGEALGIIGGSGSGKSTLARAILGLEKQTKGEVWFLEKQLLALAGRELRLLRPKLQMVFQNPGESLNPFMRVSQIVAEPLVVLGGKTKCQLASRVGDLLESCGLDRDVGSRYPHHLSGGEQQRVAIARALGPRPELIVLDEPTSSLDTVVQAQILSLLGRLRKSHSLAMILISHDIGVVQGLCQRIAVMEHGTIVDIGSLSQLERSCRSSYARRALEAHEALR